MTYDKDGAVWYKSTEFGDDKDRVLVRSDGQKTYIATDFAYHKDKIERGFGKLVNILGADHHKEAEVVKSYVKNVLDYPGELDYILTQIVHVFQDGKGSENVQKKRGLFCLG